MTESTYGALAAFSMLVAYRLLDQPTLPYALLLGVLLGLAALARGEALILLPLLLIPLIWRGSGERAGGEGARGKEAGGRGEGARGKWGARGNWRPGGLRTAAAVCVAFVLVLTPWTIRNWSAFDRPVLIATEGGETLAGANCDPTYYGSRTGAWAFSCARFDGRGNEAAELNEAGRRGLRYARHHVGRLPVVLAARVARTWGLWQPFAVPEGRRKWVQQLGAGIYFALIPLAAWGAVLLHRRRVPLLILMAPFVTVTLTSLLAYGQIRFRHSAELSLVVLAGVALDRLIGARERRRATA
jgi:hypothetical protein